MIRVFDYHFELMDLNVFDGFHSVAIIIFFCPFLDVGSLKFAPELSDMTLAIVFWYFKMSEACLVHFLP